MESISIHEVDEQLLPKEYHDLDQLFGSWSEEEFNKIQKKINAERRIDTEIWK